MPRLHRYFVSLLISLSAASVSAETLLDAPWPMLPQGVSPEADERWGELPNGLRYAVVPSMPEQRMVSLRLVVAAGRAHEPRGKAGLAHLLPRLMSEATSSFGRDELLAFVLSNGMDWSVREPGKVELFHTVYELDLDHGREGSLETGLRYLSEVAGAASFTEEALARKRALIAEKAAYDFTGFGSESLRREQALFRDSPFAQTGDKEIADQVASVELSDLRAYWERWYRPERMVMLVSGAVDAAQAEAMIRDAFGGLDAEGAAPKRLSTGSERLRSSGAVETESSPNGYSRVALLYATPEVDFYDPLRERRYYELDLLGRYAQQLATGSKRLGPDSVYAHRSRLVVSLGRGGSPMGLQNFLLEADKAVHRLYEFGVRDEDLQELRPQFLSLADSYDVELSAREWPPMLADRLVRSATEGLPFRQGESWRSYLADIVEGLSAEGLAATCEEVFNPKRMAYYIELPEGLDLSARMISKRLKSMRKGYDYTWERAGEFQRNWNMESGFNTSGVVDSTQLLDFGKRSVLRYAFRNNLRVNLIRAEDNPGEMWMRVSIGNGMTDLEQVNPSFGAVARAMVPKMKIGSGPQARTMQTMLEATGLEQVDVGVNQGQLFWSAKGSKPEHVHDFLSGMVLWMVTSQLDEDTFDSEMEALKEVFSSDRGGALFRRFDEMLFPEDERLRSSYFKEDLDAIDHESFREWMKGTREKGYVEITIVGDVEPRLALRDLRKTIGSAPVRTGKVVQPRHGKPARFGEAGVRRDTIETSLENGYVSVYWPQVEKDACAAELRSKALKILLTEHASRSLGEDEKLLNTLRVSLLGVDMAPMSGGLRLEARCSPERSAEAERRLLEVGNSFAAFLTPELVAAAERSVWVELKGIERSASRLVALFDQSQGKPNHLKCVMDAIAGGLDLGFESYADVVGRQFLDTNARGAVLMPEGR